MTSADISKLKITPCLNLFFKVTRNTNALKILLGSYKIVMYYFINLSFVLKLLSMFYI